MKSQTIGAIKTSKESPIGAFSFGINRVNEIKNFFDTNHRGMLYKIIRTSHMEYLVLWFPKRFIPSTTIPMYKLLFLSLNMGSISLIAVHY